VIWFAVLAFILGSFLRACSRSRNTRVGPAAPLVPGGDGPQFPGGYGADAPPPYSAAPPPGKAAPPSEGAAGGWRPGFWTGTGLGALGAHLYNNVNTGTRARDDRRAYDWEHERWGGHRGTGFGRRGHQHQHHQHSGNDRGEGSSGLGRMQTSTGFGGSSVR
jgi:hypothetical protein